MEKYDVVVLGGGPAGISAGIYSHRAGANTLVIDGGGSALIQAKTIQNYYGIEQISGEQLYLNGIEQYKKLGGKFIKSEVTQIKNDFDAHTFLIELDDSLIEAKAVILALGRGKKKTIKELEPYQNSNVSYCAICDGFFYKGKNVAVIGDGNFALSEVEELSKNAKTVYLLSQKPLKSAKTSKNIKILEEKIQSFEGKDRVEKVVLTSKTIDVDGVFVALGSLSSFEIAKQLGLLTSGDNIDVDKSFMTNVAGVFAVGDCVGGLLQVSKAVGDGAVAGIEAVRYVKMLENE